MDQTVLQPTGLADRRELPPLKIEYIEEDRREVLEVKRIGREEVILFRNGSIAIYDEKGKLSNYTLLNNK